MAAHNSPLELSERGQILSSGSRLTQLFEIVSNQWHPETNPDGYVNLAIAENDIMHEKMAAYIEKVFRVPHNYLTYLDGGAGSRRLTTAIARFLNRHLNPFRPIERDQIVVANGSSTCIESISFNLANPGDGILLGRPYYRAFLPDIETRPGARVVPVSFGETDPFSIEAVKCYEDTIKDSQEKNIPIKALMLCHPHNPLGRCYPKETIVELMKLCQKYRVHLISDEIYALSIWENTEDTHPPPTPFVSALSIDTTGLIDAHLLHIIWGMSKDFGANGLRIGCIISQANKDLIGALTTVSLYTYPSNLADYVTSQILEDDAFTDSYIRENNAQLSQRFSVAARFLTEHGIPYARHANAAFFICADLGTAYRARHPDLPEPEDLTNLLEEKLMEKKVFIVDSYSIGSEKPGWFRIVFSQKEMYLKEGLKRILAAVEDSGTVAGTSGGQELPTRPKVGDGQANPVGGLAT